MRISLLSTLVFVLAAGCTASGAVTTKSHSPAPPAARLALVTIRRAGVSTTVRLPAQLAAYQEVTIFPKVNGYVKTVLVDIGSRVTAGTLLMELEAPELEQATSQAKERYARAAAELSLDQEHYQRLLEAAKTDGAISPLDLSTAKAKMEADSALANAERDNWRMQKTMQTYLQVTAPFDGVITDRNIHPGALVSAAGRENKPMLELKDVGHLRLQVDVPEGLASTLHRGDTISFFTSAFPGRPYAGRIDRKSMNVNTQLRSERVEADVMNPNWRLTPGMYADVMLHSRGNPNALAVPKTAVITNTEHKYVLAVRQGKTVRIDVSTGNESADQIEVYGDLHPGDRVVAKGGDDIGEGVAVIQ
jgi:RND family efflux transporter MFP subunit